MQYCQRAFRYF